MINVKNHPLSPRFSPISVNNCMETVPFLTFHEDESSKLFDRLVTDDEADQIHAHYLDYFGPRHNVDALCHHRMVAMSVALAENGFHDVQVIVPHVNRMYIEFHNPVEYTKFQLQYQ